MPENPSAFPLKRDPEQKQIGAATLSADGFVGIKYEDRDQLGMTLRDYFAAQAICLYGDSMLYRSLCDVAQRRDISPAEALAAMVYELADAMLVERERSK